MRLIDATKLVETLNHHWDRYPLKRQELIATLDIISMMPEAVVRCKECVNYSSRYSGWHCYLDGRQTQENDFCSWGERREDETD